MEKELAIFHPKDIAKKASAILVAAIIREGDGWAFHALGKEIGKRASGTQLLKELSSVPHHDGDNDTQRTHRTKQIIIKNARNLKSADLNGLSDPYAKITCLGHKYKTKTHKKTLNPVWDFAFDVPNSGPVELFVEVWDWDAIGSDDFLGTFRESIDTSQNGEKWITLLPRVGKKDKGIKGEVCVQITD